MAPATRTCNGYISKLRQPYSTSSPSSAGPNRPLAQAHRPAADGDVLGPQPPATADPAGVQVLRQRRLELGAAVVRVAVDDIGGALDGRADAGNGPKTVSLLANLIAPGTVLPGT